MDPLSALASGIAIAGLAQKIIHQASRVVTNFRDAPYELDALKTHTILLQILIREIESRRLKLCLTEEHEASLHDCLLQTEAAISEILNHSNEYVATKKERGKRCRLKWAFLGSLEKSKCELRIQGLLSTLHGVFLLMIMDRQDSILLKQEEAASNQQAFIRVYHTLPSTRHLKITQQLWFDNHQDFHGLNTDTRTQIPKSLPRSLNEENSMLTGLVWKTSGITWLRFLGLSGLIQRREGNNETMVQFSGTFCPLWFSDQRKTLIKLDVALRTRSNPWRISARYLKMTTLNTVPENSDIIYACRNGAVDLVKELFRNHRASIYDVTSQNWSLLFLAIEARSAPLVRFLLEQGADVDQTFGKNNTNALQWALLKGDLEITRLIIDKKPDGSHVSTWKNWNCLIYLLEGAHKFGNAQTYGLEDFMLLLNRDDLYIDTETVDTRGILAIQLAACWYSAEIIRRILNLGASIAQVSSNPWIYPDNPILYSIHKSDLSAFKLLLPYYKDVDAVDGEGNSMLIYTTRAGNVDMTDLLLERGAKEIIPNFNVGINEEFRSSFRYDPDNEVVIFEPSLTEDGPRVELGNSEKCNNEWLKPWVKHNYYKYLKSLERYRRVKIEWDTVDENIPLEIFWNIMYN